MENPKHIWCKLERKWIKILFVYFTVLLILSPILIYYFLFCKIGYFETFTMSVITSSLSSLCGSTIFYVRKLYKSCINLDILTPETESDFTRQIGVFSYFFFRPIFSPIIAVIFLFITKIGVNSLSKSHELSDNFILITCVTSFFIGYLIGQLIDRLKDTGEKFVNKLTDVNL